MSPCDVSWSPVDTVFTNLESSATTLDLAVDYLLGKFAGGCSHALWCGSAYRSFLQMNGWYILLRPEFRFDECLGRPIRPTWSTHPR